MTETAPQRRNVIAQCLWLLRYRPAHLLRAGRGYSVFWAALLWRSTPFGRLRNVTLGKNVRLQKNGSCMAEVPDAHIQIGDHTVVYEDAKIEAYGQGTVDIGRHSIVGGARIVSRYRIAIGERFLCSWNVFIQDYDSHPVDQETRGLQVQKMVRDFLPHFTADKPPLISSLNGWHFPGEEVVIGDDVWIGANCSIFKGAHIGSGSIVATGSVVVKGQYPERSLLAGNPATVIKQLPGNLKKP